MPAKLKYMKTDPDGVKRGAGYYYQRYGRKGRVLNKVQRNNGTFIVFRRPRRVRFTLWSKKRDDNIHAEHKYGKNRAYQHTGDKRYWL